MKKIFVKLADSGSIFHEAGKNITVTGKQIVEVEETARVKEAVKFGALILADKDEYEAYKKSKAAQEHEAAQKEQKAAPAASTQADNSNSQSVAEKGGVPGGDQGNNGDNGNLGTGAGDAGLGDDDLTVEHTVTKKDLEQNKEWKDKGYKAGDVIKVPGQKK